MTRTLILAALALAACAPEPAQRGVGFDDFGYDAAREAELRGSAEFGAAAPAGRGVITVDDLAAAGIAAPSRGGVPPAVFGEEPLASEGPVVAPATPGGNPVISDEQDFGAVSSRESIESDRERLAAQRQAYRVITPEPLPQRPADTGPNIVAYALETTNRPGERIYTRGGLNPNPQARFTRNCGQYSSPDKAQEAFLASGGPERDRMGLDPDGDGFACYWDPRPFRTARGG